MCAQDVKERKRDGVREEKLVQQRKGTDGVREANCVQPKRQHTWEITTRRTPQKWCGTRYELDHMHVHGEKGGGRGHREEGDSGPTDVTGTCVRARTSGCANNFERR